MDYLQDYLHADWVLLMGLHVIHQMASEQRKNSFDVLDVLYSSMIWYHCVHLTKRSNELSLTLAAPCVPEVAHLSLLFNS